MDWTNIWEFLGKSDVILGILTAIISVIIWLKISAQNYTIKQIVANTAPVKDYEKLVRMREGVQSENPKALCLSLVPTTASIKPNVKRFLDGKNYKMDIVELNRDGMTPSDVKGFIDEMRKLRRSSLADATELHLFYQGPVPISVFLGAALDNWIPVKIYHHSRETGTYQYWGILTK